MTAGAGRGEPTEAAAASAEQAFFDVYWERVPLRRIAASLNVPGVDLRGKRVLICSCGTGEEPVRAVNAGAAEVHAFDISSTAVRKALQVAAHNDVRIAAQVMDFHALAYPSSYFDVIFGSAILHHVDCGLAGREIHRCLKPGGVAYFCENSDRNPLLRWARRVLFGSPGQVQRRRALGFRRFGTDDEYPLTDDELRELRAVFGGALRVRTPRFVFFEMLALHGWRNARFLALMQALDRSTARVAPRVSRFSFIQDVVLQRAAPGAAAAPFPADAWALGPD